MEDVVVASFDPTVFSKRPLSNLAAHQTVPWKTIKRDYPRLCTIHLATKMPIVLETTANIRKWRKVSMFPRRDAVYYDPFTRYFYVPDQYASTSLRETSELSDKTADLRKKVEAILNREPTDEEMVKFFKRMKNIAKDHYTRTSTHRHMPLARSLPDDDEPSIDQPDKQKLTIVGDHNTMVAPQNKSFLELLREQNQSRTEQLLKGRTGFTMTIKKADGERKPRFTFSSDEDSDN